ncbi:hypothetical protein CHF27_011545 [Romboutsia maritimum]|uniref:Dockerin domain-containing protein n=1 Tax=Romboutsia maritimum TaxID=2020948 RepID=A0A371IQQ9_9FIRM|nr:hypothetical protein [Romboutsia maritimum]RDY22804.1 hypothetical protein CHF27_011545 [Romboutsia maritimum]
MKKKNKLIKIFLATVITISMCLGSIETLFAQTLVKPKTDVNTAINKTGALMYKNTPDPGVGTFSGEWTILSLARAGYKVPQEFYDKYYNNVVKKLKECNGNLHRIKYTEYSRVILGLTSIGKDVTDVGGYNLLEKLADFKGVIKQGINGPIFALIALDTNNYEIPIVKEVKVQSTRDKIIDYILEREITKKDGTKGGWALMGNVPDPDITAMALQSLAKYKDSPKVKPYIDRALNALSKMQLDNGGYNSWGTINSESIAQVIVALTALGIDPAKDERFIKKDGNWIIPAIMEFYVDGGGFKHVLDKEIDAMATDQGMYAIVAYDRFVKGKNKLYDMTDAKSSLNTGQISDSQINIGKVENKTQVSNKKDDKNSYKGKIQSSVKSSTNKTTSPVVSNILYEIKEECLVGNNKQVVYVQFANEKATPQVKFNNDVLMYYSNELSNKNQVPTYIGLFDKGINKDALNDINKYKFNKNTASENITFGDVNGDNIINAQDALNTVSVVLKKIDKVKEKEAISMDNNGDCKVDNIDVIGIIDKYLSNKECNILNKVESVNSK